MPRPHSITALVVACAATAARADVSGSGSFNTTVPIEVPTLRGIAPSVRLAYGANEPNGIAGVGWTLDASSTIARTGPRGGLSAADDAFELDGEPLVPCATGSTSPSCTTALAAFGSAANYYSTRRESFARIYRDPATDSWTVWTTGGHISKYVTHDGGQRWLLDRKADRHGNALQYGYHCAIGAECELTSIRWGDHAVNGAEVHFYYEARPDPLRRANGVAVLTTDSRLRSITVSVGGRLARAYRLTYGGGARSFLAAVTQYASDATVDAIGGITQGPTPPLPATTFTTGGGSASNRVAAIAAPGLFELGELPRNPSPAHFRETIVPNLADTSAGADGELKSTFQTLVGDFDGDARTDFVNVYVSKPCATVGVNGVLARKSGYDTIAPKNIASLPVGTKGCQPTSWVADVDGDHRDDLITKFRDTLYVSRFTGLSFRVETTTPWTTSAENCSAGDVDGDLRDDLVCLADQGTGPVLVTARSRGNATFAVSNLAVSVPAKTPLAVADINNDGLADVVLAPQSGAVRSILTMTSSGLGYTPETQTTPWLAHADDRLAGSDVDGDGLVDVVLMRANTSLKAQAALTIEGTSDRYELISLPSVSGRLADIDGDGRTDIVEDELAYLGDGAGGFSAPILAFPVTTCTISYFSDVDGDGRTDRLCVQDLDYEFQLDDYAPATPARDLHRWMSGDTDGDGRGDYVYVYAMNPGIGVRSVLGGTQRVAWQQAPTVAIPGLDDSSASHWLLADVGGPSGKADGRDDLVMIDTDGAALRIYAMLSNGDGTFTPNIQVNLGLPNASDLGNYWPLDVDGNGTTDLVHLAPSVSGVRMDVLRSGGDGTWTASQHTYFAAATPRIVGATSFRQADVNGDGLVDLVHAYSGAGVTGTAIRVLVSRGDGTFGEVSSVIAATYADVARWSVLDINNDGAADLVHATSATTATSSGVLFESLLGRGDGRFVPGSIASVWLDASARPELRRALESTAFLMPADLDGDRQLDFWHISQYRDVNGGRRMLFVELRNTNGGAAWQAFASTPAVSASAPWAWRSYRDTARVDGAGLALVDSNSGVAYLKDLPSDRLARIDNGTGGATTIAYAPLPAARIYLPAGALPTVVTEVATLDYAYKPLVHRTTYRYAGANWSNTRRSMAFAWIEAREPRATTATTFAIDDACAGTPLAIATFDSSTQKTMAYTQRTLVAPGAGPVVCLVQQESSFVCEGSQTCRRELLVDRTYDNFGNVVTSVEQAAGAPTRTEYAPVWGNNAAYVVDLPLYRSVFQDTGTGPELLRLDEFVYDNNASAYQITGPLGDLRRIRQWDSTTQQFYESTIEYDSTGLAWRTVDPGGLWVETFYDQNHHAFPERSCTALGCVTSLWDPRFAVQTRGVDLDNGVTIYNYDAHGRLVTTTSPDGGQKGSRLLAHGVITGPLSSRQRVRVEVKDDSAGDGVLWSETWLDGFGRPYRTTREGGATSTMEYDDDSRKPSRTSEVFPANGAPVRFTTFRHDALGRLVEQISPDGSSRRWVFSVGRVETFDQLNRRRALELDGYGQVLAVTDRLNGADIVTTYGYDALHRLVGTSDALGNATSYYFDSLGRMIGESDPDRGLREYTYYPSSRLHVSTDAKGQQIEYVYDLHGRPTMRTDQAGGTVVRTVRWTYDELPGQGAQGASRGRVVRVDDDQVSAQLQSSFHYDPAGRIDRDVQCVDGICYAMQRTYDAAGRVKDLTYPDAEVVHHAYDDAGRLVGVGDYVTATYTLDGLADSMTFGNMLTTKWERDPARRWIDAVRSSIYEASYERDLTGAITDLREDAPTGLAVYTYTYDDLGRVVDAVAGKPQLDRHFTYDEIGRITSHSKLGTYTYGDPLHVHAMTSTTGGALREYDANGNTTRLRDPSGRAFTIQWTVDDRPSRIGDYRMAYDVVGRRVKKDGPHSASYFGPYVAVEDGELAKFYFAGEVLIARQAAGSVTYYHHDHVRAVRATTDANGDITSSFQYDVFGAPIVRNTQKGDDIAFGSVHNDFDLDLVYLSARYYDPIAARFLSADSVVRDAMSPQSLDRYAYVEGDPVNHIDPSGHMRRDVELMKERKEGWRALMVSYDQAQRSWCEPFCAGVPRPQSKLGTYVHSQQMRTICTGLGRLMATDASEPDGQPEPEGNGGGGCSPKDPTGCIAALAMSAGPMEITEAQAEEGVEIRKGTQRKVNVKIDGAFDETTLGFIVTVALDGSLKATVTCQGDCPMNLKDLVKVDGQYIVADLTRATGTRTTVKQNGADEKSINKIGGGFNGEFTGKLEGNGKFSLEEWIAFYQGGSLQSTNAWKLDGSHEGMQGTNRNRTDTVTRETNPLWHSVTLQVIPTGPDPAKPGKGIEVIKGQKVNDASRDKGPDYSNWNNK